MIQWLRSVAFIVQMYGAMLVIAVLYFPWAVFSPAGAHAACHAYCRWVIWTMGWMTGLRVEVRGIPPTDEVMVAAKHQSFLDILVIYNAVPRGKFIMKRQIMFTPLIGQYALRIGCVPVNRGKRGAAIKKMLSDVKNGRQRGGQLIIYPQGTRVAPGVSAPYKVGTAALYDQLGQACVPVATNVGLFWPKRGITRKPGLGVEAFLARLETDIETTSNALLAQASSAGDQT